MVNTASHGTVSKMQCCHDCSREKRGLVIQAVCNSSLQVGGYREDHELVRLSNGVDQILWAGHPTYLHVRQMHSWCCIMAKSVMRVAIEHDSLHQLSSGHHNSITQCMDTENKCYVFRMLLGFAVSQPQMSLTSVANSPYYCPHAVKMQCW